MELCNISITMQYVCLPNIKMICLSVWHVIIHMVVQTLRVMSVSAIMLKPGRQIDYIYRKWVIILALFVRWLSSLIPTGGMYFKIRVVYQICGLEIQQWPNIACHLYLMKWRVILFGNVACPFIEYTATSYFMMLWTWLDVASHLWCKKQLHLRMCYNYLCRL